jgi:hypothetical protein
MQSRGQRPLVRHARRSGPLSPPKRESKRTGDMIQAEVTMGKQSEARSSKTFAGRK